MIVEHVNHMATYKHAGDENTLAYHSERLGTDIYRESIAPKAAKYSSDCGMPNYKASLCPVKFKEENPCKERQQFNKALANGLYGEECKHISLEDYYG